MIYLLHKNNTLINYKILYDYFIAKYTLLQKKMEETMTQLLVCNYLHKSLTINSNRILLYIIFISYMYILCI